MSKNPSIIEMSLKELAERIQKRELTVTKVATAFLDRTDTKKHLNTVIYCNREQVLAEAALMDQEAARGEFRGPMHGVPIMIKDNIHVKGVPNTAGCPALKDFIPKEDAPSVELLRKAGFLIIAKNNMHELAYGVSSNNAAFGRVKNPHNEELSAGGSSGGTGAAVAARMTPAGIGSDTGGSIRIPSSFNGISGFRPSTGRYPMAGVTPISYVRDTIGPMATSVDDLIILDEILSGEKFEQKLPSLKGLRLGISGDFFCSDLDAEVEAAFQRTKSILSSAGVEFVEVNAAKIKSLTEEFSWLIIAYGSRLDLPDYLKKFDIPLSINELAAQIASPDVKAIFDNDILSDKYTQEAYEHALNVGKPALLREYHDLFEKHQISALIFPSVPCLPVKCVDMVGAKLFQVIRNCESCTFAAIPSASIPMGNDTESMPIGLMIDGLEKTDQLVLSIAKLTQSLLKK